MALRKAPEYAPWMPPKWQPADVSALQACVRGEANKDQQQHAIAFIINDVCGTYEMTYIPASPRDTDFAEGKRFVGNQLVKLIKLNLSKITKKETENG